jgi:hypothetical protein
MGRYLTSSLDFLIIITILIVMQIGIIGIYNIYSKYESLQQIIGGKFDIGAFLESLRNKYKNSTIEVEIKLTRTDIFDKIVEYIRNNEFIETNTTNQIWPSGVIKTTDENGKTTWSRKKRISKYMLPIGKMTIAEEESDILDRPETKAEVIRKKKRISTSLNDHWRIDCTWVNDNETPEIELEYIADDYWNAEKHIPEIEQFIQELIN